MIFDPKCEKIGISFSSCEQTRPTMEVNDYNLIFDVWFSYGD
jgi:hypothetical protein